METKQCFIGICGATTSGKTTLSKNIAKLISADEKKIIHLDYYFSRELIKKYKKNAEIPEVLKWNELAKDIDDKERIIKYQNNSFIIAEGFLLFKEPLFHNFDKSIFIQISKEECKKRRNPIKTKTVEYFENKIWKSYIKNNYHLAKYKKNKDMKFGGDIFVLDSTKETAEEMAL